MPVLKTHCNFGHARTLDNLDRRGRCKICNRRRAQAWRDKHPDKVRAYSNTTKGRKHYQAKKYGITPERYEELVAAQNGVCAICQQPERKDKRLSIDHDHTTNLYRGLLCDDCNTTLGKFKDDPARFRAAAEYLESFAVTELVHA